MQKVTFKQSIKAGAFAAATATVINAIIFFIFHATGTLSDSIFIQPNQPLTLLPVIISSIMPTLIASVVFFLLEKYTNNGFRIFSIIAIVLGLFSLSGPFMAIEGVTAGYALVLDLMHIVVVSALLYFISKAVKATK